MVRFAASAGRQGMALVTLIWCTILLVLSPHQLNHLVTADTDLSVRLIPDYPKEPFQVGTSHRAITINGKPTLMMAGCIHYPRSTPDMWPSLMEKSKAAGINVIETYVFWNHHEIEPGVWDFQTGNRNLPLFLKLAREHGLYVNLRLGPYVCAEWQYGGFPEWLRHLPDIHFRTWNKPFQREMARYVRKLVDVASDYMPEKGGPVIMMQVENEYGNYQWNYGKDGDRYATWCGELAQSMNTTVPWIMCRQWSDVPYVIPTHNDFYCHHYLAKFFRKHPYLPGMWTENWPGWFQRWGEARPTRPVEDIAYAVARWFAAGGSYNAYYMWHGGTNFGRTSGPMITTSYDYDVMLDEYGLERFPKYHHLQKLHLTLFKHQQALLTNEVAKEQSLGDHQMAYVYGDPHSPESIIFLVNEHEKKAATVHFRGLKVKLPRWSVTLLQGGADKPNVVYCSAKIEVDHPRTRLAFEELCHPTENTPYLSSPMVRSVQEPIPHNRASCDVQGKRPLEQLSLTNDTTDYLWYVTDFTVSETQPAPKELTITKVYEMVHIFVDGHYVSMERGAEWVHVYLDKVPGLNRTGTHTLQILLVTMGWTNGEVHMEDYKRGILGKVLLDKRDITHQEWGHTVGLAGEYQALAGKDTLHNSPLPNGNREVPLMVAKEEPAGAQQWGYLTWHQIEFFFDESVDLTRDPPRLALDLQSMTKGYAVVNGRHLGRYWLIAGESPSAARCQSCDYAGWFNPDAKCRTDCGEPSQRYYHLPAEWLNPTGEVNVVTLFEEIRGNPQAVKLVQRVHQLEDCTTDIWATPYLWIMVMMVASAVTYLVYTRFTKKKYDGYTLLE
ncbi:hypothetical protein IWQ61_001816 [Dispira simplex]|nr:hypothetical protein IWQ61_001816 [Dispira simplex]